MSRNLILSLPLAQVMRSEIALTLQQMLGIYTVGGFVTGWRTPHTRKWIEQVFDSPEQASHAAATCAAWLGETAMPAAQVPTAWWRGDAPPGTATPPPPV